VFARGDEEQSGPVALRRVLDSSINIAWNDNSSDETGFKIERSTNANTGFTQIALVGANTQTSPLDDKRVRQAMNHALDRKRFADVILKGTATPINLPWSQSSPAYDASKNNVYPFDLDRARVLLKEAGVPIPFPISLQVTNTQDQLRYAQALQASVAEGGFDLAIVPVEYSTLLDVQKRGDFELLMLGWSGRIDPDGNTSRFLSTGAAANYGGYSSPEFDAVMTQASRSTDTATRAQLYGRATQLLQRAFRTDVTPIVQRVRLEAGGALHFEVRHVSVYDLDTSSPRIRFRSKDGALSTDARSVVLARLPFPRGTGGSRGR